MIAFNRLTVYFGGEPLFKDISFTISNRDRIGLVGKNGAGKSTMLKIMVGEEKSYTGQLSLPKDIKIGYLPQQMVVADTKSLFEESKTAFSEQLNLQKKVGSISEKLGNCTDYSSKEYQNLLNELSEINERIAILGGGNIEEDIENTLLGLGFLRSDFARATNEFSGGWRMRIELAKILLQKPDVFLLDEPTNHLDIESIQWLENFLKDYKGALVLVSHDKAFLDNVTTRTIEISLGQIFDYKMPYSQYVVQRKERREQQLAAYTNQQKMIEETEKFIERFRYKATKAVQVQSRIKQLEKLDRIEIEEEDKTKINIKFPAAPRAGAIVLETKGMSKSYGSHLVLDDIDLVIERGEKIAFVGKNGEGKTTLVKVIMQEIDYLGECKQGHKVNVGYFAQNQAQLLDENKTVFETIDDIAVGEIRTKIRDLLGAFLFGGETIDKKVMVLSGGERSRLALAALLLEPYNLLVLDEPTNHLDMPSKEILKQALLQYDGTLILVSHDRDFLDGLVDKVYEFKNKKIRQHIGGIYDFLRRKKMDTLKEIEQKEKQKDEKKAETSSDNKKLYEEKKEHGRKLRKIMNQIKKTEEFIEELEENIAHCEKLLAFPGEEAKDKGFYEKYESYQEALLNEMEKWEKLNAEYAEMEKQKS
ncbi:MAG: glycosyl transferase family 2 [Bacteroidia bacterium]|nr:MAG: glycosyl transferase family 2 [Bacteroidia bacterium]